MSINDCICLIDWCIIKNNIPLSNEERLINIIGVIYVVLTKAIDINIPCMMIQIIVIIYTYRRMKNTCEIWALGEMLNWLNRENSYVLLKSTDDLKACDYGIIFLLNYLGGKIMVIATYKSSCITKTVIISFC